MLDVRCKMYHSILDVSYSDMHEYRVIHLTSKIYLSYTIKYFMPRVTVIRIQFSIENMSHVSYNDMHVYVYSSQ